MGGAAATLTGARLISMGIRPEQIRVITFGAPAVGNAAFAAKFEPLLPLTRVVNSGDPVTGILQTLVGGYKQFGQEIKWTTPATVNDPHLLIGSVVDTTIFSTGTYNLTPLEAFIHASKGINSLQHTWLRDTTIHESSKNQVYANQLGQ